MTVFAGTGHRPPKLGGYSRLVESRLEWFACDVLRQLGATQVISGMALGWDQALAEAARQLSIPYIAAVPFAGQESRWPEPSRNKFNHLLESAEQVIVVSEGGYSPHKMQIRNEWMVDHCEYVLAMWDGSSGGTANCIKYANQVGVTVCNVYKPWQGFDPNNLPEWAIKFHLELTKYAHLR